MSKIIYRLTEPTEFTRHYETAAWWTKIMVPAGDYEARTQAIGFHPTTLDKAYWVLVTLPGVVTDEYMPSLYGGVPLPGSDRGKERVGTAANASIQAYGYNVRDALADGTGRWVEVDA